MAANANIKQRYLAQLDQNCKILLSDQERQYLSYALKDYRSYKSVEKLVRSLATCLNTSGKLPIIRDVRNFISPSHLQKFDAMIRNTFAQKHANGKDMKHQANGLSKSPVSQGKYRIVTLLNEKADLGFKICGGKEYGAGIFVSNILRDSPAWSGGLLAYDQLVEVNGISLQNIPLQSAANLLASLNKLKLVVKEEENKRESLLDLAEINPWSLHVTDHGNTANGPINPIQDFAPAEPGFSSLQSSINESPGSLKTSSIAGENSLLNFDDENAEERIINLTITTNKDGFIGFNIRGGCEYGLGIYVSSVDKKSIAEECGIKVGDQILQANGKSFENILHKDAVDFFKSHRNVALTVKAVGRIPAEKCFIEEYSWLAPDGSVITGQRKAEYLSSSMPSPLLRDGSKQLRDFGTDAAELPMNETINLPVERLSISTITEMGTDPITPEIEVKGVNGIRDSEKVMVTIDVQNADEEDAKLRRSPSATSQNSKKSSDSGKSERGNKSANSGEFSDSDRSRGEGGGSLSVSKAKRSKSFLQKQGDRIKAKFSMRSKKKAAKQNIFDSELYQKSSQTKDWLHYIEEKAKSLLSVNNYKALMKQIKDYLEKGDIELFSSNVLELLDTPGKPLVLDIRAIVFPHDLGRFDARISKREMDNLISNGEDIAQSPILDGQLSEVPPKRTLVTAVQDKGGKFRLKSQTEAELFEKAKEESAKKMSKKYSKQRSILERDMTIERYKSFSKVPRPSKEHTESWSFELDDQKNEDLDYIPTKGPAIDVDELYAKVDKSNRGSLNGVFPTMENENADENSDEKKQLLERAMSDIAEDQEYAVPDFNRNNVNGNKNIDDDNYDDDDDDYTKVDSIIKNREKYREIRVNIEKQGKSLGISISGGKGSTQQPEIRIERVYPGGAIADVGVLKAGYRLISVDGNPLENATHNEAVDLIRKSFTDKTNPIMNIVASNI